MLPALRAIEFCSHAVAYIEGLRAQGCLWPSSVGNLGTSSHLGIRIQEEERNVLELVETPVEQSRNPQMKTAARLALG